MNSELQVEVGTDQVRRSRATAPREVPLQVCGLRVRGCRLVHSQAHFVLQDLCVPAVCLAPSCTLGTPQGASLGEST